jgi:hypothetical protein
MSAEKHTPGPWLIGGERYHFVYSADQETGHDDAENLRGYGGHLIAESITHRNVKLVAAAPLLLERLQEVLLEDSRLDCADRIREAIRAAGEEPAA